MGESELPPGWARMVYRQRGEDVVPPGGEEDDVSPGGEKYGVPPARQRVAWRDFASVGRGGLRTGKQRRQMPGAL
jgi:hypothetical protein